MFSPDELKAYEKMGCSAHDAVRAIRPGGPADCYYYATTCKGCGRAVRETIRWFYQCQFYCSCGAFFDYDDMLLFMAATQAGAADVARSIKSVTFVERNTERDDE